MNKKVTIVRPPARKRARRGKSNTETTLDEKLISDEMINDVCTHVERDMIPRIFAAAARRYGNPTIRPCDYYCSCTPCSRDFLPVCKEQKPDCRFSGRLSPEEIAAEETSAAIAALSTRISCAIKEYSPRPTAPGD